MTKFFKILLGSTTKFPRRLFCAAMVWIKLLRGSGNPGKLIIFIQVIGEGLVQPGRIKFVFKEGNGSVFDSMIKELRERTHGNFQSLLKENDGIPPPHLEELPRYTADNSDTNTSLPPSYDSIR